jgi:hypothetical protein
MDKQDKIIEVIKANRNLPFPKALEKSIILNHLVDSEFKPKEKDDKGHPYLPSNGKKYWKNIRKARKLGIKQNDN